MQSDPSYRHARLFVLLPEDADTDERAEFLQTHLGVPTDGRVELRRPRPELFGDDPDAEDLPDGWWEDDSGQFWRTTIPFRDHRKDDAPWAADPDRPKGKRQPIWKWENPEGDPENITLSPSYGRKKGTTKNGGWSGDYEIHCWIKTGEIDLL